MDFFHWAVKVLRKWVWLLGFVPILLDYFLAYIPQKNLPETIRKLISEGANWQITGAFFVLGFLASAFFVHEETKKELMARIAILENENEKLLADSISENSIILYHFSTSVFNGIEGKYVMGNEPISVMYIVLSYFDKKGIKIVKEDNIYFGLLGKMVTLDALNVGDAFHFKTVSKDDVKDESVMIKMGFKGLRSGKQVKFERQIPMKPNQVWAFR
jgi:hypothetical protein